MPKRSELVKIRMDLPLVGATNAREVEKLQLSTTGTLYLKNGTR